MDKKPRSPVSVRLSAKERALIERAATEDKRDLSEWIRMAAVAAAEARNKKGKP